MSKDGQGWSLQGQRAASRDTEQGAEGGRTKLGRDQRALELFLWKTRRTKHIRDEVALPPVGLETLIWTVKNLLPISWQQPEQFSYTNFEEFLDQFWGNLLNQFTLLNQFIWCEALVNTGSDTFVIINITCVDSKTTALCSNPQRLRFKRVQRAQESACWHHSQGRWALLQQHFEKHTQLFQIVFLIISACFCPRD